NELPAPEIYRVLNGTVLVATLIEAGDLDLAQDELRWLEPHVEKGPRFGSLALFDRGRLRFEQGRVAEAIQDFLAGGDVLTRARIVSPAWLPWRSEAALASLALGDHSQALTLAEEELQLAQTFGAPRALGVAQRAAGLVVGRERGELLLREAVTA